ncbi:chromosome segregation protein SMC [methanogenic archaeon mixed culture ISO4-G1]|nr:chromosome segregation protein SMC [methanogenic archaeon mixed culture ISO4-G1]
MQGTVRSIALCGGNRVHLKQVEMENFKSFGGKVTVPLMEGYTAVTGPNGSGKSNITDAILFVLGPKSPKAVRAGRLTDLIFDGGKSKNKASFMKVSLVFDNADRIMPWDADEVKLTRYIKMSDNGQDYSSYFYINDQKSTLTEFDNLLTKARISAEGYNLVQQGDVTHIVQMGNTQRRGILDGISGIASFDADIDKAEGEKAEAGANLDRINIVVTELSQTVKKLEKDREAAQRYVELKDTLDMAKAQYSHRKLQMSEAARDAQAQQIERIEKEIQEVLAKKAELQTALHDKDLEIEAKVDEIAAKAGPEYKELKKKIEDTLVEYATSKDRKESAESDLEEQGTFKAKFEESMNDNVNQISALEETRVALKIDLDAAEEERKAQTAEEARVSDLISNTGGEQKELQERLEKLEADSTECSGKLLTAQGRFSKAESASDEAHGSCATIDERIQNIDFEIKDAKWTLDQMKSEAGPSVEDYTAKVMELRKKESELEKQEVDLNGAYRKIDEEYKALQAEKKVSDRMNQSSMAVDAILALRNRGEMPGIHGTIQELATVDEGYETALSVAAGNKMQAVVVDDDQVAADAIAYLKKEKLGRVTFLPLTKMMGGKPRAKAIMSEKESEGYAIDLIDFNQKYYNAFWYVLGDTLVVKDMDTARRIMGGIRIVTKAGELIEASGAMVGGTINQQKMLKFGAASEDKLTDLGEKLRKASDALDNLRQELRNVRDQIRNVDDQMRNSASSGMEQREKVAALKAQIGELEKSKKGAQQSLQDARERMKAADEELAEARKEFTSLSDRMSSLTEEKNKVKDRIAEIAPADLQARIQKVRGDIYNLNNTISDLNNQIRGAETEIQGLKKQNESLQMQLDSVMKAIDEDNTAIASNTEQMQRLKIDLDALRAIEAEMESGIDDLRTQKDALTAEKYQIENDIREATTKVENDQASKQTFMAQLEIIKQQIVQFREEVDAITFEVAQPIPSEEEIKRTIRSCENTIAQLGNVNLRAIEDYDENKARLDALNEQVDALNKNIAELTALTDSLKGKKKGLFMEAYTAVDENFKKIYAQLSGGGEAYMALEDEEDPFNGGLIINAKPRNGKLLRLEALSGGEKSLTALSFIFAIQEYQPSPFYVLDEVDMFLDSVNSEMVAHRVKESSGKAQFIQVSLRKVALAVADQLIGVTRPPSGISKIIIQPDLAEVSKYEEEAVENKEAI